jgi:hypothetical protein
MGLLDFLRKKRPAGAGDSEEDADAANHDPSAEDEPPIAVAVVREGCNVPTDGEMLEILRAEAPGCLAVPRTGLSQMRWWAKDDWVANGMRGIATALRKTHGIDPDKTDWHLCEDARGARVGIVFLRR